MKTIIYTSAVLSTLLLSTINIEAQRRRDVSSSTISETSTRRDSERESEKISTDGSRRDDDKGVSRRTVVVKKNKEPRHYPKKDVVVVTHRPERTYKEIHHNHRIIRHRDVDYSYYEGRYYKCYRDEYIPIAPPHGIRVNFIPNGYLTIMVQGIPYFYYGGVYYRQDVVYKEYEVVAPPMGAIVPELPDYGVTAVVVNGDTLLEYDNVLYKAVVTKWGVQYKVVGVLDDNI